MLDLDPDVKDALSELPDFTASRETLAFLRSLELDPPAELSDKVERSDRVVEDDPRIIVRVHRPIGVPGPLPCIYVIHGGGFVCGSYAEEDPRLDEWCQRHGVVGVSVEYRLSPETPFPGPLDDCYRGLEWVYENHEELGVDAARIGVAGSSAGGGLAAGLALLARDRGEIPLFFQLLDCPMLDDRQITPSSQLEGLVIWSRESNSFGWRSYLGTLYGTPDVPAYAAPARAVDLRGLPPAYVCVGAVDGFRDEDIDYATRLSQADVPTELHVYEGAPHSVTLFPDSGVGQRYAADADTWIASQLESASPR